MYPMVHVYGDDGADAKKERVVAVAVIAGTEEWWQQGQGDLGPRAAITKRSLPLP
jgi:hypothetical protein